MNPVLLASTSAMAETTPERVAISTSTTLRKAARLLYRRLD